VIDGHRWGKKLHRSEGCRDLSPSQSSFFIHSPQGELQVEFVPDFGFTSSLWWTVFVSIDQKENEKVYHVKRRNRLNETRLSAQIKGTPRG
jgi:hypothetical protein